MFYQGIQEWKETRVATGYILHRETLGSSLAKSSLQPHVNFQEFSKYLGLEEAEHY
jgi:hypothetical protein